AARERQLRKLRVARMIPDHDRRATAEDANVLAPPADLDAPEKDRAAIVGGRVDRQALLGSGKRVVIGHVGHVVATGLMPRAVALNGVIATRVPGALRV